MKSGAVVASVAFLMLSVGCSNGPALPDGQAKELMQSFLNRLSRMELWLGNISFVREGTIDPQKGREPLSKYALYRAYAELGLLFLDSDQDLSSGFTGWNDFFALSQSGVQRRANVLLPDGAGEGGQSGTVLNDAGQPVSKHVGEYNRIQFVVTTQTVDAIVSNDRLRTATDEYRQIVGTHSLKIDERIEAAWRAMANDRYGEKRRFRALLKFDPITKVWKVERFDEGDRDRDFGMSSVPERVREIDAR